MMHISMFPILDSDACVCDAHIYDPPSLTLMHVCMMHISMIQDLDPEACMYGACIYDAKLFGDGRTKGQTNKAILGVGCISVMHISLVLLSRVDIC